MPVSFVSGCAAGFVTGILHVKLKINNLLSGIITMTALLSVNYLIAGGPSVSFSQTETLLSGGFLSSIPRTARNYVQAGFILLFVVLCKVLLDLFLKTKSASCCAPRGTIRSWSRRWEKIPTTIKCWG